MAGLDDDRPARRHRAGRPARRRAVIEHLAAVDRPPAASTPTPRSRGWPGPRPRGSGRSARCWPSCSPPPWPPPADRRRRRPDPRRRARRPRLRPRPRRRLRRHGGRRAGPSPGTAAVLARRAGSTARRLTDAARCPARPGRDGEGVRRRPLRHRARPRFGCGVLVSLGGDLRRRATCRRRLAGAGAGRPRRAGQCPPAARRRRRRDLLHAAPRLAHAADGPLHHIVDPAHRCRPAPAVWRTVSVVAATCVLANTLITAARRAGRRAPAAARIRRAWPPGWSRRTARCTGSAAGRDDQRPLVLRSRRRSQRAAAVHRGHGARDRGPARPAAARPAAVRRGRRAPHDQPHRAGLPRRARRHPVARSLRAAAAARHGGAVLRRLPAVLAGAGHARPRPRPAADRDAACCGTASDCARGAGCTGAAYLCWPVAVAHAVGNGTDGTTRGCSGSSAAAWPRSLRAGRLAPGGRRCSRTRRSARCRHRPTWPACDDDEPRHRDGRAVLAAGGGHLPASISPCSARCPVAGPADRRALRQTPGSPAGAARPSRPGASSPRWRPAGGAVVVANGAEGEPASSKDRAAARPGTAPRARRAGPRGPGGRRDQRLPVRAGRPRSTAGGRTRCANGATASRCRTVGAAGHVRLR